MFTFDKWGDWAEAQAARVVGDDIAVVFRDSRQISEYSGNPSFAVEIITYSRAGSKAFWKVGLCDFEIIDTNNGAFVEYFPMLKANDPTIPDLFKRFLVALKLELSANGN